MEKRGGPMSGKWYYIYELMASMLHSPNLDHYTYIQTHCSLERQKSEVNNSFDFGIVTVFFKWCSHFLFQQSLAYDLAEAKETKEMVYQQHYQY